MKGCFEVGITQKFFKVIQNVAEVYGKTRENKEELIANTDSSDQAIRLEIFSRGPLFMLLICSRTSMVILILEIIVRVQQYF